MSRPEGHRRSTTKPKRAPSKGSSQRGVPSNKAEPSGVAARRVAIKVLVRIEKDEAYANLVLGPTLERSQLSERDRAFVTELVYGTTRMQRACDFLIERYLITKIDHEVRAALRLGAYQLRFLSTAPHGAVSATVGAVKGPGRGVVNAVLRKLSAEAATSSAADASGDPNPVAGGFPEWPNDATRLSYPTWMVKKLSQDLGSDTAVAALEAMNRPAKVSRRADGYVQDEASQLVVKAVLDLPAPENPVIIDLCAAPGGKATGLASSGAVVVAGDLKLSRAKLIQENSLNLGSSVHSFVGDGLRPPLRNEIADLVLIDAPCSGLGSMRRRADSRWRIDSEAPVRLAQLQFELIQAGLKLLKPGGILTYSVCTLTNEEGPGVLDRILTAHPDASLVDLMSDQEKVSSPWTVSNRVAYLLPSETDGMMLWQIKKLADKQVGR